MKTKAMTTTTMPKITRESLMTLEAYAKSRNDFRAKVLEHKKSRAVHVGAHVTLPFEDERTIRDQVQKMLRTEKTFEEAGIQDERDAYNPLVPDGRNFKATMLIEYEEVEARKAALAKLKGIEDKVWPLVAAGKIRPVIDSTFPLAKASEAHARMESSQHIGKIVLTA